MLTRIAFMATAAALIAAGLTLRLVSWGLPLWIRHSGGGFLWGALIYALVACAAGARWQTPRLYLVALAIIVAVESSRLLHTPILDRFRLTLVGQLLLGRVFSISNVLVDALGAAMTAGAAMWIARTRRQHRKVGKKVLEHKGRRPFTIEIRTD